MSRLIEINDWLYMTKNAQYLRGVAGHHQYIIAICPARIIVYLTAQQEAVFISFQIQGN